MKKLLLTIVLILGLSIPCFADSMVGFTWDANTEPELEGYNLYQTNISGDYDIGVDIPVAIIPAGTETVEIMVEDGTWLWIVTSFGLSEAIELESGPSNEVVFEMNPPSKMGYHKTGTKGAYITQGMNIK